MMSRAVLFLAISTFIFVRCQQVDKGIIDDIFSGTDAPDLESKYGVTPKPNSDTCECVSHYLCRNDSTINTSGAGLIDIRVDEDAPCKSYLDFCCYPPDRLPPPTPPPHVWKGCGRKNPEGVGFRITGDSDNEAQFGELPWMVAVLYESVVHGHKETLNVYQCGGALIHPQVVLTAAHCVADNKKIYKIRAGEWDTQTTKEIYPHQNRRVARVIIHSEFHAESVFNDIALLILENPVELASNVDIICLPTQDFVTEATTRCIASGWGKDVFGQHGKYQVILKRIDLPVVDRHLCQERLRTTRLSKFFKLHKSFMCAGGEPGKDTCKGDGGSPLVCPIPGRYNQYYHAGIVSWGIGCGEKLIPGVYANVALFRNWIDAQMTACKFDYKMYQY